MAQNIKNKRSNSSCSQAQSPKAMVINDLCDVSDLFCVYKWACMCVYDWVHDSVCAYDWVWLSGGIWLSIWLGECVHGWFYDCVYDWVFDSVCLHMTECDSLCMHMIEYMTVHVCMTEYMTLSVCMTADMTLCVCIWFSIWLCACVHEWVHDSLCVYEWVYDSVCVCAQDWVYGTVHYVCGGGGGGGGRAGVGAGAGGGARGLSSCLTGVPGRSMTFWLPHPGQAASVRLSAGLHLVEGVTKSVQWVLWIQHTQYTVESAMWWAPGKQTFTIASRDLCHPVWWLQDMHSMTASCLLMDRWFLKIILPQISAYQHSVFMVIYMVQMWSLHYLHT